MLWSVASVATKRRVNPEAGEVKWIPTYQESNAPAQGSLLPVWLAFSLLVNVIGWLLEKIDGTDAFYGNVLIIARKPCA